MKYLLSCLSLLFIFSCSDSPKETSKEETSVALDTVSNHKVEESIPVEIEQDKELDYSIVPDLKEKLEQKIQNYLIANNYLKSQYTSVKNQTTTVSDDYSSFQSYFEIHHLPDDMVDDLEEQEDLIDKVSFNGTLDISNLSSEEVNVTIKGTKTYVSKMLSYYGDYTENRTTTQFNQTETFAFSQEINSNDYDTPLYQNGISRKLTRDDLGKLAINELGLLRNEFYARKGYIFKTDKMKNHFSNKTWYQPTQHDYPQLTDMELTNIFFIKSMEEEIKLTQSKDGSKLISSIYEKGTKEKLTQEDLSSLNVHQLKYLRNEFFARKGYIFKSDRLSTYFNAQSWYTPSTKEDITLQLSTLETNNVALINSEEQKKK